MFSIGFIGLRSQRCRMFQPFSWKQTKRIFLPFFCLFVWTRTGRVREDGAGHRRAFLGHRRGAEHQPGAVGAARQPGRCRHHHVGHRLDPGLVPHQLGPSSTTSLPSLPSFSTPTQGLAWLYWVLLGFIGFEWVLLDLSGLYWV